MNVATASGSRTNQNPQPFLAESTVITAQEIVYLLIYSFATFTLFYSLFTTLFHETHKSAGAVPESFVIVLLVSLLATLILLRNYHVTQLLGTPGTPIHNFINKFPMGLLLCERLLRLAMALVVISAPEPNGFFPQTLSIHNLIQKVWEGAASRFGAVLNIPFSYLQHESPPIASEHVAILGPLSTSLVILFAIMILWDISACAFSDTQEGRADSEIQSYVASYLNILPGRSHPKSFLRYYFRSPKFFERLSGILFCLSVMAICSFSSSIILIVISSLLGSWYVNRAMRNKDYWGSLIFYIDVWRRYFRRY